MVLDSTGNISRASQRALLEYPTQQKDSIRVDRYQLPPCRPFSDLYALNQSRKIYFY